MEFVNTPGPTRPLTPQAVVLLDPATGLPYAAGGGAAIDSTGASFNPDACSHAYGYAAGLLVTDAATNGANTWIKTYSYTAGVLTGESKWVKQ